MNEPISFSLSLTMIVCFVATAFLCGAAEQIAKIKISQKNWPGKLIIPSFQNIFWLCWSVYFLFRFGYIIFNYPEQIRDIQLKFYLTYFVIVSVLIFVIRNYAINRIRWVNGKIFIKGIISKKQYNFFDIDEILSMPSDMLEIRFFNGEKIELNRNLFGVNDLLQDINNWFEAYSIFSKERNPTLQ